MPRVKTKTPLCQTLQLRPIFFLVPGRPSTTRRDHAKAGEKKNRRKKKKVALSGQGALWEQEQREKLREMSPKKGKHEK